MNKKTIIYWSRRDLRLHDNPALTSAARQAQENNYSFLPIFVLEDYMCEAKPEYQFGYPSRYFLSQTLPEFSKNFENFSILRGKGAQTIINLQKIFNEIEVYVNEDVYIDFYKQIEKLKKNNIEVTVHADMLTVNKELKSGNGNIYSIFTPFKKACWNEFLSSKVLPKVKIESLSYPTQKQILEIKNTIKTVENNSEEILKEFSTNRKIKFGKHELNLSEVIKVRTSYDLPYKNEEEVLKHFKKFLKNGLVTYKEKRDFLNTEGTSKMSLALAWGLVSARTLKQEVQNYFGNDFLDIDWFKIPVKNLGPVSYISELIWREFYKYLFFHFPKLMNEEFQEKFRYKVEWIEDREAKKRFIAWIKGETGYKIVDAAMEELRQTGWMHNRARMIVASVLTKNLGVDWRWGQEYFRSALLDLDESSNNGGWQWGASVGADPKPIRIFNPYLQAEKYDKDGEYQKKWLLENNNSEKYFFETPPIVDHKEARLEALRRYGLGF